MTNDSVREELIGKVSARLKPFITENRENQMMNKPLPTAKAEIVSPPVIETPQTVTTEIAGKATSPTLVEFHSKNATVPEWRLQLQNAVRQRQGQDSKPSQIEHPPVVAPRAKLVTSGANALKAEAVESPNRAYNKNPDLARALERIEKSRQKFLVEEEIAPPPTALKSNKNYKFYIASKTNEADIQTADVNPPVGTFAKPKLAPAPVIEKVKLDTNKLPPLPNAVQSSPGFAEQKTATDIHTTSETEVKPIKSVENIAVEEVEEYDDSPTFAMRFNAGLFDLIIGSFVSLCLLTPFMLMGGEWLSGAGFLAFAATCAIVMFLYLTTAIGLYGSTFGMRLFSLELVDIEGEEYPTFHQAAVSSSVYLLSLAFAGTGFLTVFFNEDKRAVHDLVSGTIIVKE
jgi:uncharacterized RDD family membrane protein YckC